MSPAEHAAQIVIDYLRQLRIDGAQSQRSVADALGVTQAQVSKWEAGQHPVTLDRLVAWCAFLEVDAVELARVWSRAVSRAQRSG